MLKNFLLTGDTHSQVYDRLLEIKSDYPDYLPEYTGVIILGDAGLNYYEGIKDYTNKELVEQMGYTVYCVRGNHEKRPEDVPTMLTAYDDEVDGEVYYEQAFPHIRYFQDGGRYTIQGLKTIVLGGAYSVDKDYRLSQGWKWFNNEQLSEEERSAIFDNIKGEHFDLVLTHTVPINWEPTDLFLPIIDQSTVDKTTELWLQDVHDNIDYSLWCAGHYHDNRFLRPRAVMLYHDIYPLNELYHLWDKALEEEFPWWYPKDPNYYMSEH